MQQDTQEGLEIMRLLSFITLINGSEIFPFYLKQDKLP